MVVEAETGADDEIRHRARYHYLSGLGESGDPSPDVDGHPTKLER